MVSWAQVESAWPAHAVAIHEGRIYAVAGRTTHLPGGIQVVVLDAMTGKVLQAECITDARYDTRKVPPGQRRKRWDKKGEGHHAGPPRLTAKGLRVKDSLLPMEYGPLPTWLGKPPRGAVVWNQEMGVGGGKVWAVSGAPATQEAAPPQPLLKYDTRSCIAQALVRTPPGASEAAKQTFLWVRHSHKGDALWCASGTSASFAKGRPVATLPHPVARDGLAVGADGSILVAHENGMLTCLR
jgi:hypothetical protein